ncbi:hypothetical protein BN129_1287 [Cronobacter sakazakii 701]|nr:hypothetical protein BN129_1287 [Cronobacter sakazakii 701]
MYYRGSLRAEGINNFINVTENFTLSCQNQSYFHLPYAHTEIFHEKFYLM